ncbi:hypothetical protein ACQ4LE_005362 [Meloidogyne hapla]|uniref:Uncharacterized protein n=1 Tax=Meloidogyne hapla TaxID=6305 RepID=A0A1I8B108_MELHA
MFKKFIILFLILFNIYLNFVQAIPPTHTLTPPYDDFILQYEYYSMNNVEIYNIPLNIREEIRHRLFINAFKAIYFARNQIQEVAPYYQTNPNEPIHFHDQTSLYENTTIISFDFKYYLQNQSKFVVEHDNHKPFANKYFEEQEEDESDNDEEEEEPDHFNNNVKLYEDGRIESFYFMKWQYKNTTQKFSYSELHGYYQDTLKLIFEQAITHRASDWTIISILQSRVQNYNIN